MPSQHDIDEGATALRYYVYSIDGWKWSLVPWTTYENGAKLILDTYDTTKSFDACGPALYQKLSEAGYGSQVSPDQCAAAARAVLVATGRLKGR